MMMWIFFKIKTRNSLLQNKHWEFPKYAPINTPSISRTNSCPSPMPRSRECKCTACALLIFTLGFCFLYLSFSLFPLYAKTNKTMNFYRVLLLYVFILKLIQVLYVFERYDDIIEHLYNDIITTRLHQLRSW